MSLYTSVDTLNEMWCLRVWVLNQYNILELEVYKAVVLPILLEGNETGKRTRTMGIITAGEPRISDWFQNLAFLSTFEAILLKNFSLAPLANLFSYYLSSSPPYFTIYFNFAYVFGKNYDLNYFALPRRETDVTPLYKVHRFNNTNSNAVYPGIPLIEMESLVGCELRFFCITFYPFSVFRIFYIQPRPKLVSLGGNELGIFRRPAFLTRRRGV